jgi:corrinoid protein of di/trimethylamine methyltransferase
MAQLHLEWRVGFIKNRVLLDNILYFIGRFINLNAGGQMTALLQEISELLQKGKANELKEKVQQALDAGIAAKQVLNEGLMAGMDVVGERFKKNEIYIPEVLIAARAMNAGIEILKPLLVGDESRSRGKVVIGTVFGDLHDIGKNLVKIMMEGKGLEVIDLGTNVSAEKFISAAREHQARIIACSALLTTTMVQMEGVVKRFQTEGLRKDVTIMVGGAPVTEAYCRSIGADLYADDAATAAELAIAAI